MKKGTAKHLKKIPGKQNVAEIQQTVLSKPRIKETILLLIIIIILLKIIRYLKL